MRWFVLAWGVAIVLLIGPINAQGPASPPGAPAVTFKFSWDQGRPWTSYTITVDQAGNTHFEGIGNAAEAGDDDTFTQDFPMTAANRDKIFDLAKRLNYFQGNFEAKQKNIAKTGTKTLAYRAPGVDHGTTYNYSPNQDVQQLTHIFQSVATTLDYGRKLAYQYRFDKLGMDSRLKELSDQQSSNFVEELHAIEPILRKIADDPNMMHINRQEARKLLKSLTGPSAANPPTAQP